MFEAIGRFAAVANREVSRLHLRVLTRADPAAVASALSASNLPSDAWSVDSVPHAAVPSELSGQQAGLHFLHRGLSEHSGSPTKIGEYWASGLPVLVTPNMGDTDGIIRRERVGVIVDQHSDEAYCRATLELRSLLNDPDSSQRCRRAAEKHYALEPACEQQVMLYHDLVPRATPSTTNVRPLKS